MGKFKESRTSKNLLISFAFESQANNVIKNTYDNLLASASLENNVHTHLYPKFAEIAREENYERAAQTWDAIIVAERHHEKCFLALAENIRSDKVFKRDEKAVWRCTNCGYLHAGPDAPDQCPACLRSSGYFELLYENW